jgi:hypothetical protein
MAEEYSTTMSWEEQVNGLSMLLEHIASAQRALHADDVYF